MTKRYSARLLQYTTYCMFLTSCTWNILKHTHTLASIHAEKSQGFSLFKNYPWCIDKTWCFKCEYSKFNTLPGKRIVHEFMHLEYGYEVLTYRTTSAPPKGLGHSLKCTQHCSNKDRKREMQQTACTQILLPRAGGCGCAEGGNNTQVGPGLSKCHRSHKTRRHPSADTRQANSVLFLRVSFLTRWTCCNSCNKKVLARITQRAGGRLSHRRFLSSPPPNTCLCRKPNAERGMISL